VYEGVVHVKSVAQGRQLPLHLPIHLLRRLVEHVRGAEEWVTETEEDGVGGNSGAYAHGFWRGDMAAWRGQQLHVALCMRTELVSELAKRAC
jgi:hypothetical protein